jgi:hypothetical protein
MPVLFTSFPRTDASPKRQSEELFVFYERNSRPEFETYRSLLGRWLAEMPPAHAADLASQMKGSGDLGFESGLIELVMHASLVRLGHRVEIHPTLNGNGNRPDFLIRSADGEPRAYIEVTTINTDTKSVADEQREAVIQDRLNAVLLPEDMRLGYHVEKRGPHSPSLNRLVTQVEIWARTKAEAARSGATVKRIFAVGGWEIGLRLIPGFKPRLGGRQIAWAMQRVISMDTAEPAGALMRALDRKATRYGQLGLPYIIVVADRTEKLAYLAGELAENVAGGLFGPEITEDVKYSGGRREMRHRRGDGFWMRKGRPNHSNVSAVLVFPRTDIWKLREEGLQPILARNPFAVCPLPQEVSLPFRELIMSEEEGTVRPGQLFGDILGLPVPWPPEV